MAKRWISELLKALTHDPENAENPESYHPIRDSMRDTDVHFDIYPLA